MQRLGSWGLVVVCAVLFAALVARVAANTHSRATERRRPVTARAPAVRSSPPQKPPPPVLERVTAEDAPVRWIAAGGGPNPELNQVSLEQDLQLTREVLGPSGRVLFAAGPLGLDVQVLDPEPRGDPLLIALGRIFSPRGGRDSRYRRTTLAVDGAATSEAVLGEIAQALDGPAATLLVYLAGHGEKGESPQETRLVLWADTAIGPAQLADVLDRSPARKQVRVVMTACHAGAFADLAFLGANAQQGPALADRCGFFATIWEREASGCDPNPQRSRQEGYGIHFLHALRQEDRDGHPLERSELDLDGDSAISLLEAHARARITSQSIDVPTSTSERWLRSVAVRNSSETAGSWPEEYAVVAGLAARLGLTGRTSDAAARLEAINVRIGELGDQIEAVQQRADDLYRRLGAELLGRWPVLDDPWHPDYSVTLSQGHDEILAFLQSSPDHQGVESAEGELSELGTKRDDLEAEAAPLERLVRAMENIVLANRLRRRGGAAWRSFERLLACERSLP